MSKRTCVASLPKTSALDLAVAARIYLGKRASGPTVPYLQARRDELWPYIPAVSIPVQFGGCNDTKYCKRRRGDLYAVREENI